MAGSLFFMIVIIVILRNVVERSKTGAGKRNARDNAGSLPADRTQQSFGGSLTHRGAAKTSQAVPGKTASAAAGISGRKTEKSGERAAKDAEDGQVSTTEYLRQKALEDQREHEEEARREAMRLHRETGGRRAAQRHYDGDSIPQGMRLVKCGYCGAENLIGNYEKQQDFTCYFCREVL